ncbi:hypothetical protein ACA910_003754 [Epithemia clementina (nom. ined.)]
MLQRSFQRTALCHGHHRSIHHQNPILAAPSLSGERSFLYHAPPLSTNESRDQQGTRSLSLVAAQNQIFLQNNNDSKSVRTRTVGSDVLPVHYLRRPFQGSNQLLCYQQHHRHQQLQQQARGLSTFVSKHYQEIKVDKSTVLNLLSRYTSRQPHVQQTDKHMIVRECPFCSPTNNKADNLYKLYILQTTGAYFCHRCGASGSWFDFRQRLRNIGVGGGGGGNGPEPIQSAGQFIGGEASASTHRPTANGGRFRPPTLHQDDYDDFSASSRGEESRVQPLPMPNQLLTKVYSYNLLDNKDNKNGVVLRYLKETRGLTEATLRKYGVGQAKYKFVDPKTNTWVLSECITFPWMLRVADIRQQEELRGSKFEVKMLAATTKGGGSGQRNTTGISSSSTSGDDDDNDEDDDEDNEDEQDNDVEKDEEDFGLDHEDDEEDEAKKQAQLNAFLHRRIKVRSVEQKSWQRLDPPGGGWGLFGFHTVPLGATEVVLTEGEFDAMAVWQATRRPAISLPNGCRSLPPEVLPLLERFKKIYLWMDFDEGGVEGAQKFSKKLGWARCYIVLPSPVKDANDALRMGLDLNKILDDAKVIQHNQISIFGDLKESVYDTIMYPLKTSGTPIKSLPQFTKIIKGFRRGELTVLTGPTGSGKTTFLCQQSLDLAEHGVNVLWGSFEVKNTALLRILLQQFSKEPLPTDSREKLEAIGNRFSQLPISFMNFHGASDIDEVLEVMDFAAYVNDTEHFILDNLQFMISREKAMRRSFDKFDVQDLAVEKIRRFATERNVHVTLVLHPRKEAEDQKLSMASFSGTPKATQEADTVIILQSERNMRYLEVKKNRFDGTLGTCRLFYDQNSRRYSEQQTSPQASTMGEVHDPSSGNSKPTRYPTDAMHRKWMATQKYS